jgi:predicted CoA-binding protein
MTIREILQQTHVIAMVGLSDNPQRASFNVAHYLMDHGYTVIPVNPTCRVIQRQTCYPDLSSIPQKVDVVDIFRRPEEVVPIVEDAVKIGAKVVWMQLGIVNEKAAAIARKAGLEVVMDRCMKAQHQIMMSGKDPS